MDVILPLLELGLIGILIIAGLVRLVPDEERAWLQRILMIAFGLRMFSATVFVVVPGTRIFQDDAAGYEGLGMALANYWHDAGPPIELPVALGNYGYHYVNGALYYIFGSFRAVASEANAVLGTVSIFLIYRLSRRFFHVLVARRAVLLMAFVPSMILWNSIALKDTLTTFLIVLTLWSCIRLKDRFTLRNLLLTLLPIIAIQPIRFYMLYFLGLAVVVSLFFERGSKLITGVPKSLLIAGMAVALLAAVGLGGSAESAYGFLDLERVSVFRHGMADTANSGFANDVDISTPGGALAFLPIGMSYLLLAPFPWQFGSVRSLFAAPETVLWWIVFPSMIRGLVFSIRKRFAAVSPIVLFTFALIPAYSLMHGNVGSAFRQRAQIFVFLFIFTAVGQYASRLKKAHRSPDLLLSDAPNPPEVPQ
jgi:4-amino-4-deoxy-L-arabinose transferase-like glycosyltransferase